MKKLVVYYTMQGNTKKVAEIIADKLGTDIIEISPKKKYTVANALILARRDIENKNSPEIEPLELDIGVYEEIIIGTPVWWYTFTPPIRTFIKENDLSGKKIRLFCTHRGAPGSTITNMKETIGKADYIGNLDFCIKRGCNWAEIENHVLNW